MHVGLAPCPPHHHHKPLCCAGAGRRERLSWRQAVQTSPRSCHSTVLCSSLPYATPSAIRLQALAEETGRLRQQLLAAQAALAAAQGRLDSDLTLEAHQDEEIAVLRAELGGAQQAQRAAEAALGPLREEVDALRAQLAAALEADAAAAEEREGEAAAAAAVLREQLAEAQHAEQEAAAAAASLRVELDAVAERSAAQQAQHALELASLQQEATAGSRSHAEHVAELESLWAQLAGQQAETEAAQVGSGSGVGGSFLRALRTCIGPEWVECEALRESVWAQLGVQQAESEAAQVCAARSCCLLANSAHSFSARARMHARAHARLPAQPHICTHSHARTRACTHACTYAHNGSSFTNAPARGRGWCRGGGLFKPLPSIRIVGILQHMCLRHLLPMQAAEAEAVATVETLRTQLAQLASQLEAQHGAQQAAEEAAWLRGQLEQQEAALGALQVGFGFLQKLCRLALDEKRSLAVLHSECFGRRRVHKGGVGRGVCLSAWSAGGYSGGWMRGCL